MTGWFTCGSECQSSTPVRAFTAYTTLHGVMLYSTPFATSAVASCRVPAPTLGMSNDHARPSLPTLVALIWSSGLYRVSDQSRLYEIHSSLFFAASFRALSSIFLPLCATTIQADMLYKRATMKSQL